MISPLEAQLYYCLCPHEGCSVTNEAKFRPFCLLLFHMKITKNQNKTLKTNPVLSVSLCLSIRLSVSLAISSLSVYIFLFSSACLCPYVYVSILFIRLSIFIYLYLSVCVLVLVFSFMLHCYSVLKRVKTPLKSSPWQSRPHWKQHKATSMSHKLLRHESGQ